MRTHLSYSLILLNSFKKYMAAPATRVWFNIIISLPDCFPLVFDRQTTLEPQYIDVFAAYRSKILMDTAQCVSVFDDITIVIWNNARWCKAYRVSTIWAEYTCEEYNFVAIMGDSCNVNHCISSKMEILLMGYASHLIPSRFKKYHSGQWANN